MTNFDNNGLIACIYYVHPGNDQQDRHAGSILVDNPYLIISAHLIQNSLCLLIPGGRYAHVIAKHSSTLYSAAAPTPNFQLAMIYS